MHKRFLDSTVIILNKESSGENFLKLELFCPNNSKLLSLNRCSTKLKTNNLLDLFDIGHIHLTLPQQNGLFFVKEFHPILHHKNIPKNYTTFFHACNWIKIVSKNLLHIDNLQYLFSLTQKTLHAFNASSQPHSIYLKTLYLFVRQEGYPIKEDWLVNLSPDLLNHAICILKNPLSTQNTPIRILEILIQDIHSWMTQKTEILLPN